MPIKLLRDRTDGGAPAVTNMELFFDLVYVFAVTQLSHPTFDASDVARRGGNARAVSGSLVGLESHGLGHDWADPNQSPVRAMMVVLMFLSLVMAAAIPKPLRRRAKASRSRTCYCSWFAAGSWSSPFEMTARRCAATHPTTDLERDFGCFLDCGRVRARRHAPDPLGSRRWRSITPPRCTAARCPIFGSTPMPDWTLAGGHLAERNQLVVLIALGETILAAGATFSDLDSSTKSFVSFIIGFLGAVSLWWIYFVRYPPGGQDLIEHTREATRLGRNGFAYAHGVMVAGIIVVAVAIDLTMEHPDGSIGLAKGLALLGGPALYLAGNALFNFTLTGRVPGSRLIGIAAVVVISPLAWITNPLALAGIATLITLALAVLTGSSHRGEPTVANP